ncbi:6-bladed beta-propeller [candidate division KSB1 bacterium]
MKFRNIKITTFCLFFLLFAAQLLFSQEISTKNGVKHIHNKKPKWGDEPEVKLLLLQQYGELDPDDEKYMMNDIMDVIQDKDKNVYILEMKNNRIKIFNHKGKYLKTIGRGGQGPGEFQWPNILNFDLNEDIYVFEPLSRMLKIINKNGKEKTRFIAGKGTDFRDLRILESGQIVASLAGFTTRALIKKEDFPLFNIFDIKGNLIKTFGEAGFFKIHEIKGKISYEIGGGIEFEISDNNTILYTELGNNIIGKLDLNGETIYTADRPLKYQVKRMNVNPVHSRLKVSTGIGVDQMGNIWVSTITKYPIPKSRSRFENFEFGRTKIRPEYAQFEVFSNDGIYLGYIPVPISSFKWRIIDDRLLMIDEYMTTVYEYKIVYN